MNAEAASPCALAASGTWRDPRQESADVAYGQSWAASWLRVTVLVES